MACRRSRCSRTWLSVAVRFAMLCCSRSARAASSWLVVRLRTFSMLRWTTFAVGGPLSPWTYASNSRRASSSERSSS